MLPWGHRTVTMGYYKDPVGKDSLAAPCGVVVAAGVYAVVTIFVTPTYESRVSFYVYNSADNSSQGTINNSDLQAAESLATTYSKIP